MSTTTVTDPDIRIAKVKEIFEAALAELPTTGVAIAAFFGKEKISGTHGATNCPVANYIKAKLTAAGLPNVKVSVSSYSIILWENCDTHDPMWEVRYARAGSPCSCADCQPPRELRFNPAISGFVEDFDDGKYPGLDERLVPLRASA